MFGSFRSPSLIRSLGLVAAATACPLLMDNSILRQDLVFQPTFEKKGLCSQLLDFSTFSSSISSCHMMMPKKTMCEGQNIPLTRYSVSDAVEVALPAVVNIIVISSQHTFGPFVFGSKSSGSGFLVPSNRPGITYAMTNAHVVGEHATQVDIAMEDGRVIQGTVKGRDFVTDIAIVEISSEAPLPTVNLGDSSSLRPGEFVVVLGSPLTLQSSVTLGVVSNLHRQARDLGLESFDPKMEFIQTDAAINEGNSGGPIINLDGQVVGIATMKVAVADGISFAIPINIAKQIMDKLLKDGLVKRPYLGFEMMAVNPMVLDRAKNLATQVIPLDVSEGVLVTKIEKGSPAQRDGLKVYDIIVDIDGHPIRNIENLFHSLGDDFEKGLVVTVLRGPEGKKLVLRVTPDVLPVS